MKKHSRQKTGRYAAIDTLYNLSRTRLPLSHLFEQSMTDHHVDSSDRQLAMKICYGVLRQKEYLDQVMAQLCRQPLTRIKPFAYHALQTGLFQLLFLDRVPTSAVVNETVKAVAAARLPKPVQGFVNGVLRQSIRKRSELPQPNSSSLLNHPEWLTRRWHNHFGAEAMKKICRSNNREPSLCLRLTPRTTTARLVELFRQKDITTRMGRFAPDALVVQPSQGSITTLPGFEKGFFQVQDQAAQLATLLLGPFHDGTRILDCCAGVGGKTAHLLSLINTESSSVVALEPSQERLRQLEDNTGRLADSSPLTVYNLTLEAYQASANQRFDRILVDAPCSGTGVIGRHPDIRWNREEYQLMAYQKKQRMLLDQAEKMLSPGGVLVYATCSIEPEENYQVINHFLAKHSHFTLTDCSDYLPSQAHALINNSCFAPLPDTEIDGFFAARLTSAVKSD